MTLGMRIVNSVLPEPFVSPLDLVERTKNSVDDLGGLRP